MSGEMRRVRLTLEYDGTNYSGWQRQINAPSVQQTLEEALLKLTGTPVALVGASRTDAGVHAMGQVVHFDTASGVPDDKFCYALNTMLPADIRVVASGGAKATFHARFHAKAKIYRYLIHNAPHAPAIDRHTAAHVFDRLDETTMDAEARAMLGTHDFRAFAASGSEAKTTVRTIRRISVARHGQRVALFVEGDGFLYNMVRILAGTLIGVGGGKLAPGAIDRALQTGDRLQLGATAPARGLMLMQVFYESNLDQSERCFREFSGQDFD